MKTSEMLDIIEKFMQECRKDVDVQFRGTEGKMAREDVEEMLKESWQHCLDRIRLNISWRTTDTQGAQDAYGEVVKGKSYEEARKKLDARQTNILCDWLYTLSDEDFRRKCRRW